MCSSCVQVSAGFLSLWKIAFFWISNVEQPKRKKKIEKKRWKYQVGTFRVNMRSKMENMQNHQRTPVSSRSEHTMAIWMWFRRIWIFAGKLGSIEWSTKENDTNPHESCTEFDLSRCKLCTCQFTFIMRSEATPCHKAEHSSHFSSSLFSVFLYAFGFLHCPACQALLLLLLFSKPILSKENECDILLYVFVCECKMAIENNKALHQIQTLAFAIVYLCAPPRHETHIIQLFPFLLHTSSSLCRFVGAAEEKGRRK